ncbi:hypothetical protein [Marinilactibacillus psychrotolerans]|uniref:hypothetical protein n=1 Tax=Marinilactibacillus psychrotolerans TaxID=191770 RepID=UPI0039B0EF0C
MKHVKASAIILIAWIILSLQWIIPIVAAVIGGVTISVMVYVIGDLLERLVISAE